MKLILTERKLQERVKELTCLYEISKTISRTTSIEKNTLKKIIISTKKAWHYSDDAIVEIQVPDYNLLSTTLEIPTICQTGIIRVANSIVGYIKVHYPKNKYNAHDFLKEEQKLLDTIAFEIGNYLEKFKNIAKKQLLMRTVERIDRLSVLGEMTAGIAHELNTPLGNILGYAELIKSTNTHPEIDADISTVIHSVIYCREIVKKLMFFSCEMPQQLKLQEIKPIVTFAMSFLKQNFQEKNIKNELVFKNDTIMAKVDEVQLTQVFFNLLINALHASPKKATIKTIIESDAQNLFITIEDQGTGIPEAIKPKIFEPFFTTKTTNKGCGLGLSVVHGIIKNHNGEIVVQNNQPTGTIFSIQLPLN
ncbi:HAMP domain-containing histidine kinase [Flavobacterium bizetiae]|uniref:sensor histidine kinase n=1 Tax=Flavobacterium bizetiae TaxID=2704140 RepID=UPI0021E89D21|nr:HAMP domain-containing sensor histidine kinase [Flavobacterium bizetiae]UTN03412.1 HAMP domain-containing histidine kinase [Flavobacterium bizetiae]